MTTITEKEDKVAAALAKLAAIRAKQSASAQQAAEEKERKLRTSFGWRLERTWQAGTAIEWAASEMSDASLAQVADGDSIAGVQIRTEAMAKTSGVPLRVFVELEDGRLASMTCTQPRFVTVSHAWLVSQAHGEASIAIDRMEARQQHKKPTWGTDDSGAAKLPWWHD